MPRLGRSACAARRRNRARGGGEADWQLHAYGGAGHAFTDASTGGSVQPGFGHEEKADRRSWQAMQDFLAELFV